MVASKKSSKKKTLLPENTFLDFNENPSYVEADAVMLGVACDITCSYGKGAWHGPTAFLEASFQLEQDVPFYHIPFSDRIRVHHAGTIDVPRTVPKEKQKHYWFQETQKITQKMVEDVKEAVTPILRDEKLLMLIGGDHSITNGALQSLDKKYGAKNVTIVHFDAHLDLRESYDALEYSHASVMFNARQQGFPLVQIGIRDHISKEESDLIVEKKYSGSIFPCPSQPFNFYLFRGKEPVFQKENMLWDHRATKEHLLKILANITTPYVYLSIDMDVLSAPLVPSTGTPLPGGLSFEELQRILYHIIQHTRKKKLRVVGFDIVEIAPLLRDEKKGYVPENSLSPLLEIQAAQLAHNMLLWLFEERFRKNYSPAKKKKGLL